MTPVPSDGVELAAKAGSDVGDNSLTPSSSEVAGEEPAAGSELPRTCWAICMRWLAGFVMFMGSGLLAAVAYLDPGNLEADVNLGVASGMTLLWWTAICCLIFGFAFQCFSGRIGLVSGKDLAYLLGQRYPRPASILLWALLEIAIIGADIQETVGSAIAISLLSNGRIPLYAGCLLVSFTAFTLLMLERLGFRQLELLFGMLIMMEAVCMGVNFHLADIPPKDVAKGIFIPRLTPDTLTVAVAALGALVMPYNLYFQSAAVNARPRTNGTAPAPLSRLLAYLRVENFLVLAAAFVINMFVICVFASGFYGVLEEEDVGLQSAGDHLGERFGPASRTIWGIGLLASGQVSTIGLTYAGQLIMSGLLGVEVHAGMRMIVARLVALVPTVTLAIVFEASNTFDKVAQTLNVVQSMVLPFALIPCLHVAADAKVMGKYRTHPALTVFGGGVAAIVTAVNGYLLVDYMRTELPQSTAITVAWSLFIAAYYAVVIYFAVGPEHWPAVLQSASKRVHGAGAWLKANAYRADLPALLEVHH